MTQSPCTPRAAARLFLATLAAATALAGLSGCGGSSGNAGSQSKIRSLNLCSNGGAATIFINNGSTNGTQDFQQASGYLFLNGGNSTFTFTLANAPDTGFPSLTRDLTGGDYYSVILVGNANVLNQATKGFPFLTIVQDDRTTPASGNARVRIVQGAPDSGAVDVKIGSQSVATDFAYGVIGAGGASSTGTTPATYVDVPAGSNALQFNQTGTTTPVFGPVTESLAAGHLYTVSLVETQFFAAANPTATPPTAQVNPVYSVVVTDDGT